MREIRTSGLMSGDWKRNYGTNCDTGMGESRRQTVQPRSLRPPRQSSTLLTKYRYKGLEGALRERIRTIIRQVCKELGVQIVSGVLSREHVHMFVEIPPHIAVSDFVRRVKGRSSHRVQMEFPDLRKRYWGRHFWARGYFSTTSGNITDDVILQYLQEHEPTGVSR